MLPVIYKYWDKTLSIYVCYYGQLYLKKLPEIKKQCVFEEMNYFYINNNMMDITDKITAPFIDIEDEKLVPYMNKCNKLELYDITGNLKLLEKYKNITILQITIVNYDIDIFNILDNNNIKQLILKGISYNLNYINKSVTDINIGKYNNDIFVTIKIKYLPYNLNKLYIVGKSLNIDYIPNTIEILEINYNSINALNLPIYCKYLSIYDVESIYISSKIEIIGYIGPFKSIENQIEYSNIKKIIVGYDVDSIYKLRAKFPKIDIQFI